MKKLQEKIAKLKSELHDVGAFQIGTLSKQYNVCGKTDCRCKAPKEPVKHGPYYYLHYTERGKQVCRFVKKDDVMRAKRWAANHKRFKKIVGELAAAYSQLGKETGFKEE